MDPAATLVRGFERLSLHMELPSLLSNHESAVSKNLDALVALGIIDANTIVTEVGARHFSAVLPDESRRNINQFMLLNRQVKESKLSLNDILHFIQHQLPQSIEKIYAHYVDDYEQPALLQSLRSSPTFAAAPQLFSSTPAALLGSQFFLQQIDGKMGQILTEGQLAALTTMCHEPHKQVTFVLYLDERWPHDVRHALIAQLYKAFVDRYKTALPLFRNDENRISGFGVNTTSQNSSMVVNFHFQAKGTHSYLFTHEALSIELDTYTVQNRLQDAFRSQIVGMQCVVDTLFKIARAPTLQPGQAHLLFSQIIQGNTIFGAELQAIKKEVLGPNAVPNAVEVLWQKVAAAHQDKLSFARFVFLQTLSRLGLDSMTVSQGINQNECCIDDFWDQSCRLLQHGITMTQLSGLIAYLAHNTAVLEKLHFEKLHLECCAVLGQDSIKVCKKAENRIAITQEQCTIFCKEGQFVNLAKTVPVTFYLDPAFHKWLGYFIPCDTASNVEMQWFDLLKNSPFLILKSLWRDCVTHSETSPEIKLRVISECMRSDEDVALRLIDQVLDQARLEDIEVWLQRFSRRSVLFQKVLSRQSEEQSCSYWSLRCVALDFQASVDCHKVLQESSSKQLLQALAEATTTSKHIEMLFQGGTSALQQVALERLCSTACPEHVKIEWISKNIQHNEEVARILIMQVHSQISFADMQSWLKQFSDKQSLLKDLSQYPQWHSFIAKYDCASALTICEQIQNIGLLQELSKRYAAQSLGFSFLRCWAKIFTDGHLNGYAANCATILHCCALNVTKGKQWDSDLKTCVSMASKGVLESKVAVDVVSLFPLIFHPETIEASAQLISVSLEKLLRNSQELTSSQKTIIRRHFKAYIADLKKSGMAQEVVRAASIYHNQCQDGFDVETKKNLVWAFTRLAKDDSLLSRYFQFVASKSLLATELPYEQVVLFCNRLPTCEGCREYVTQLKSALSETECNQIKKILEDPSFSGTVIQAIFCAAPSVQRNGHMSIESESKTEKLFRQKKFQELARLLLDTVPNDESKKVVTRTIHQLLSLNDPQCFVFRLCAHYAVSLPDVWKTAWASFDRQCNYDAAASAAPALLQLKHRLSQEEQKVLYWEFLRDLNRSTRPAALCLLLEFNWIKQLFSDMFQNSEFRKTLASLISGWLSILQSDKALSNTYATGLLPWYLEFVGEPALKETGWQLLDLIIGQGRDSDRDQNSVLAACEVVTALLPTIKAQVHADKSNTHRPKTHGRTPVARRKTAEDFLKQLEPFIQSTHQVQTNQIITSSLLDLLISFAAFDDLAVNSKLVEYFLRHPAVSIRQALLIPLKQCLASVQGMKNTRLNVQRDVLTLDLLQNGIWESVYSLYKLYFVPEGKSPLVSNISDSTTVSVQVSSAILDKLAERYPSFIAEALDKKEPAFIQGALEIDISLSTNFGKGISDTFRAGIKEYQKDVLSLFILQIEQRNWSQETINLFKHFVHVTFTPYFIREGNYSGIQPLQEYFELIFVRSSNKRSYQYLLHPDRYDFNNSVAVVSLVAAIHKLHSAELPSETHYLNVLLLLLKQAFLRLQSDQLSAEPRAILLDFIVQQIRVVIEQYPNMFGIALLLESLVHAVPKHDPLFFHHAKICESILRTAIFKGAVGPDTPGLVDWLTHLQLSPQTISQDNIIKIASITDSIDNFDITANKIAQQAAFKAILNELLLWQEFDFVEAFSERETCFKKIFSLCARQGFSGDSEESGQLFEALFVPNAIAFGSDRGPQLQEIALHTLESYIESLFSIYEKRTAASNVSAPASMKKGGVVLIDTAIMGCIENVFYIVRKCVQGGLFKHKYERFEAIMKKAIDLIVVKKRLRIECFFTMFSPITELLASSIEDAQILNKRLALMHYWIMTISQDGSQIHPIVLKQVSFAVVATGLLGGFTDHNLHQFSDILDVIGKGQKSDLEALKPQIVAQMGKLRLKNRDTLECFKKRLPNFLKGSIK